MASSSHRSTRAAAAVDATTADRAGGLARGLRQSRPVAGAIASPPARLGACCYFSTCLFCMHVPVWVRGICLRTVETIPVVGLQFSRPPTIEACRDDSPSLGFSSLSFEYYG